MTSYTKKLFARNPGAAKELRRDQIAQLRYGRHVTLAQFTAEGHGMGGMAPTFGKREPTGIEACQVRCGRPACRQGCTLAYLHGK